MIRVRTRFFPADDVRGERIRAYANGTQVTMAYDYGLNSLENHREAARLWAIEHGYSSDMPTQSHHTTLRGFIFDVS